MSATRLNPFLALLAGLLWCAHGWAAPPLTQISDMLYKADGTPFNGTVTISWRSFTASDSSNIPGNSLTMNIVAGVLRIKLVPTTTAASPAYYYARFDSEGHTEFNEVWAVPAASATLAVKDVRVESASSGSSGGVPSSVTMADVAGLAEALAARPVKSATYVAGRAAMIDESGEIASVLGSTSNCVRVDGTSGACGTGTGVIGFVDHEIPGGLVNSANRVFTLNSVPNPVTSLHLFRNGVLQRSTVDFTLSGNTITFLSTSMPQTSDMIEASYRTGGQ
jgi:hypothetical protein